MKPLVFTCIVCGIACSIANATDEQDCIYRLGAFGHTEPVSVVDPLLSVTENPAIITPGDLTSIQSRFEENSLESQSLFQPGSASFIPIEMEAKPVKRNPYTHLKWLITSKVNSASLQDHADVLPVYRGGRMTLPAPTPEDLEQKIENQVNLEEKYHLLNLYHGFRQR